MATNRTGNWRRALTHFIGSAVGFRADAGLGIVGSPSPDSDYWYHSVGRRSSAGPIVSANAAVRLAAVYACTRVCAETLSSLPVGIFREKKSGGREPARDHPAQELFLNPNSLQTGMEFFEMMQAHLELRGNAYALKVPGSDRAISELQPLHPDRVRVYLLPNGRLRYEVSSFSNGQVDKYAQDEILHLRAWSADGVMGISTVSAGAEVIGVGLAQQEHRARYFHNSAIPSMAVEGPKLKPEAETEMMDSLVEGFSGSNAFKAMRVPPGYTIKPLSVTNRDAQLIEASGATRVELAGMFRVPPHKIGDLSRGTFSNIEQQNIEFATDCMRPRIVRVERRLDLCIVSPMNPYESVLGDYFVTFQMDALYRGDMKSRYEAYGLGIQTWLLRNEARAAEGLNPIDGLDEPLVPVALETVSQAEARSQANIAAKQQPAVDQGESQTEQNVDNGGGSPETPGAPNPEEDEQKARLENAKLRGFALRAGDRVVRKEAGSLRRLAERDLTSEHFHSEIATLYLSLAPTVADAMGIPIAKATEYCQDHAKQLKSAKREKLSHLIDTFEEEAPVTLADLAMGERLERTT